MSVLLLAKQSHTKVDGDGIMEMLNFCKPKNSIKVFLPFFLQSFLT